MPSPAESRV